MLKSPTMSKLEIVEEGREEIKEMNEDKAVEEEGGR